MSPVSDKFIGLLLAGCGLKDLPKAGSLPSNEAEWEEIFRLGVLHAVPALVFSAVEVLPEGTLMPSAKLLSNWKKVCEVIESGSRRIEKVVGIQKEAWKKHGIDAVLVKGPVSAAMYPRPLRRSGGDIDWCFRNPGDWERALDVVKANNLEWEMDSDGDIHYVLGGVMVEHHRRFPPYEGPEGQLFIRLEHILHHAAVAGVGMKQVCDYLVALDFLDGKYDRTLYAKILSSRRLTRFERAVSSLDPRFLSIVLKDGNMGRGRRLPYGGIIPRTLYLARLCPGAFFLRWRNLFLGRLRRF